MPSPPASDRPVIVVLGATGQQGGAVAASLAREGRWRLRAMTRDTASESAGALARRGYEVVAGNMDDRDSLVRAFDGAHGVFSVQTSEQKDDLETRRGIKVADAARDAGVRHFVYSSVGGAERDTGIPHFESKWRIEQHLRTTGLPVSVVRPTFFMDNFGKGSMRRILLALMRHYVPARKPLQMIATADIGDWVARAFAAPEEFTGRAEEIAGDSLTRAEITRTLKAGGLSGELPFPLPGLLLNRLPADVVTMFDWFGREGYRADIGALRTQQPRLRTLADWAREKKG